MNVLQRSTLNTTAEDVALVKATMGRVSGPVILVGHSYAEASFTAPERRSRGRAGLYLRARSDVRNVQTQQSSSRRPSLLSHRSRGWTYLAASEYQYSARPFRRRSKVRLGDPGRPPTRTVSTRRPVEPPGSRSRAGNRRQKKTTPLS